MKELREVERSVACGRKNFMVDAVMNGQPVKFSENGRDVSFPTFCDGSSFCILCCP